MLKVGMCDLDNQGFTPKVEMVSDMTYTISLKWYDNREEVDKKNLIENHWITNYLNRHPKLVTKFSTQVNKQYIAANSRLLHTTRHKTYTVQNVQSSFAI